MPSDPDDDPVPAWVTDRETDVGIPTSAMPEPIQEPPDLYLESQPWAKYTGAGMYQRLAAMAVRRQRLRDQGHEVHRVPWLAIGVGAVLAALMVGGVVLLVRLVQWIAGTM